MQGHGARGKAGTVRVAYLDIVRRVLCTWSRLLGGARWTETAIPRQGSQFVQLRFAALLGAATSELAQPEDR